MGEASYEWEGDDVVYDRTVVAFVDYAPEDGWFLAENGMAGRTRTHYCPSRTDARKKAESVYPDLG